MTETQAMDQSCEIPARSTAAKSRIFADIPASARPVGPVWALPQAIIMFLLAAVIAILVAAGAGVVAGIYGAGLGMTAEDFENPPGWLLAATIIPAAFGFFGALMLIALAKIKMEKRSLASAGLDGFLYGGKFWRGFLGGIILAVVLSLPAGLAGNAVGMEAADALNWQNVATPKFALVCLGLLAFVLIQSPSEEILFRGWMLSGIAARSGLFVSVLLSSLFFAFAHADRFSISFMIGVVALLATGCLGFLFAAVARRARSVLPAAGMHSGYNFVLFIAIAAFLTASGTDGNFLEGLQAIMEQAAAELDEIDQSFYVDMAGRIFIPVVVGLFLFARAKNN